jgi:hypothetical protein
MTRQTWQEKVIDTITFTYDVEAMIDDINDQRVLYFIPIAKLEEHYDAYPQKVQRNIDWARMELMNVALHSMGFIPEDADLSLEMCEKLRDALIEDVRTNFDETIVELIAEEDTGRYDVCFTIERVLAEDGEGYEFVSYYNIESSSFGAQYDREWSRAKNLDDLKF